MTTTIDWAHEIDASLVATPLTAPLVWPRLARWRRRPSSSAQAFSDYAAERGPYIRRLAHAICCDWAQAEMLALTTLTSLRHAWHRIGGAEGADAFVHRALGRASVTDSPTPRSCNARGEDYPIEDESLLFDGLQSLTVIQRKALVLHDWLDLPVAEVAAALEITSDEVHRHAARGHAALSFLMPDDE